MMQPNRTIWLVTQPRFDDISAAETFGKLYPVFNKNVCPLDVKLQKTIIEEEVKPIATTNDLVIIVGPSIMVVTLVSWFTRTFGQAHILAYDRNTGRYFESVI